jgi:RND family efflux transporter MFP subunit
VRRCIAALALFVAACRDDSVDAPPPVRPVLTVVAFERTSDILGPFAGTIEPRYKTDLGFRIFGRMVARFVDVGSIVRKGAELATLDPAVQALGLRSAEAAVANAQAQFVNAQAEERRQGDLVLHNITPPAEYELVERNRDSADANLKRAEASLQKAKDALSYTRLEADFDGVITNRYAEPGQVLNAGQKVVSLAQPGIREAVIAVPNELADRLLRANDFDIRVALDRAISMKAAGVRSIDPVADPNTRTRTVYLSLNDPPPALRLGITIAVTMSQPVSGRVDLPATALLEKDAKTFVWVVDPKNNAVSLREVTVIAHSADTISVSAGTATSGAATSGTATSGIRGGERIVIAGVHSLAPGQAVKVAP